MPKPKVTGAAQRTQRQRSPALSDVIEGHIREICRDLATQVKRMRRLQEQTDELHVVIREWAREWDPASDREPTDSPGS